MNKNRSVRNDPPAPVETREVTERLAHERIRANMLAAEAWPDGTTRDEKRLRRLLAVNVGLTYSDDGELQSSEPSPAIDFKRDSLDEIERKLMQRAYQSMSLTVDQKEKP